MRIDDPKTCPDRMREALAWDGPAIIECVVTEHEPPLPARVKKTQAQNLFVALREGTPNRNRIALQIVRDALDEASFKAVPTPHTRLAPRDLGKAAANLVGSVRSRINGNKAED